MTRKTLLHTTRADYLRIYGPAVLLAVVAFGVAYQFVEPAPPDRIVLATGEPDGAYHAFGEKYREILAQHNIDLELRNTGGSAENIALLELEEPDVHVAFVQGGTQSFARTDTLVSLATLYYEPLWIFHRSDIPLQRLTDLAGRRVYVGPADSGIRALALLLLAENSIGPDQLKLSSLTSNEAIEALHADELDVLFMVGSFESSHIGQLLEANGIRLLSLDRAEAYTRRHRFLSRPTLPQGAFELTANLPPSDVSLLAPTANLVARDDLHPALVDLLLLAADRIHGGGTIFARPGEFPSPQYVAFPLSPEARRFFEHGPPFLRRVLPFWAATLVDRLKVMLLPLIALAIPLLRAMPPLYQWRMRARVYHWYKELRIVESNLIESVDPEELNHFRSELDRIDAEVQDVTVPSSYTKDLYHLRMHIDYVREKLRPSERNA
jgi:TRAP transporter TAXI family solute receptor